LPTPTLVVLEGDQTGQELLLEALRVLEPASIGFALEFERYDLSLTNRRATANRVVLEAAGGMKRHRVGLKAATITPEGRDDVGSPNRILRDYTDSLRFDGITADAERLFVRLIMKADDYGRFHAEPRLLRSGCFPLHDNIRMNDLARWLDELSTVS